MPYTFAYCLMSGVLLLTVYLFYSAYPVMGADIRSGCYRFTTANPSPRTCDSMNKSCKVPVTVSAAHKPGMSLCFQGIDATYEMHPVNGTSHPVNSGPTRICRPLRPSQSVTSINDPCFDGVAASAKDAISASGIHQKGVYKMCSNDIKDGNICSIRSIPPLGDEQSCSSGLHTLMGTCASTENCPEGVGEVVSYYCPEVKSYTMYIIQHAGFKYIFEVKTTDLSNTASRITSYILPTKSLGDQYNPYKGWTLIANTTHDGVLHYYVRSLVVKNTDCTDYCAMEYSNASGIFHTQEKCYTTSDDLCGPTRQVTWTEFDPDRDYNIVEIPNPTEEGTIHEDASYTTDKIVKPFTYTANIEIDAARVDPSVTASCGPITADDVGTHTHSQDSVVYVRRVCDQVVLSFYDCVLQYSHHDGTAMYWSVSKADNVSKCTVYVVDSTVVLEVEIPKNGHDQSQSQSHDHDQSHDEEQSQSHEHDHDQSHDEDQSQSHEHEHDHEHDHDHDHDQSHNHDQSQSHDHKHQHDSVSKKKLPTWAIVVIVVVLIIVIAIIVIAALCMCLRTPLALDEENFDTKQTTLKLPHVRTHPASAN